MRRMTTLAQHQHRQAVDRAERIREMGRTMSQTEIAKALGITRQAVSVFVNKHGIELDVSKAAKLRRFKTECQGMTAKEAAAHMGVDLSAIYRYAKNAGIKPASPAAVARQRFVVECQGMTRKQAAEHLGVCRSTIHLYAKATGVKLVPLSPGPSPRSQSDFVQAMRRDMTAMPDEQNRATPRRGLTR